MSNQDNIIAFPGAVKRPANAPHLSTGARQAPGKILDLAGKQAVRPKAVVEVTRQHPLSINKVWDALSEARIEMHYQPQFDLATGEIMAAEALLRLVDGQAQLVYPDRFIELVEHSDLIVPLGRAVIERVCADLVQIRADGGVLPRVAINLAAHQLNSDDGLVGFIDDTLAEHGLAYADLEFELTERQRLDTDGEGSPALIALAARGAKITIDDFGIGYSSVVCLTDAGCPAVQGFGYAKPMPLGQLEALLVDGARSGIFINEASFG